MAECIEREAIMEFPIRKDHCDKERANEHFIFGIESVLEYVQNLPAADVAPVVRCKDCKYWQDNNDGYPHEECRWGNGETPDANDFCSYGEQKDGDCDALD